jgi:type VI secretion system protein ImpK
LGFQGRYRLLDNGLVQLEDLRQSLGRTVTGRKRERPQKLGPIWSAEIRGGRIRGWVPLWVVALAALAAGLVAYTIFLAVITTRIDEVVATIRLIAPGS